jgi:hypothetical protein
MKAPSAADIPKAYEQSLLYGEHTWGGALYWVAKYGQGIQWNYGDTWKKEHDAGRFKRLEGSWEEHSGYIRTADRLTRKLLDSEMEGLATGVAVDGERVVVFNPLPWKRTGAVKLMYFQDVRNKITALKSVDDGLPQLWIMDEGGAQVFQTVFIRDIAKIPAFTHSLCSGKIFDASTPYGYGGPTIYSGDEKMDEVSAGRLMKSYFRSVEEYCHQKNIICEFIRFHPLNKNYLLCGRFCQVRYSRRTVAMRLACGDILSDEITSERRRNIRKAQRKRITVEFDWKARHIEDFYAIYYQTMKKNNAEDYYYFSYEFFRDTVLALENNAMLLCAYYENKMISGAIFLIGKNALHCHFSATDPDYLHLNAASLIIYRAAEWAKEMNLACMHLGGGHSESAQDSLLRFKKSFSRSDFLDFYTGQKVYNEKLYEEIVFLAGQDKRTQDQHYFPLFRAK